MGNSASELNESEFQQQIKSLAKTELSMEHIEELNTFLKLSHDFTNFFTSCTLSDFRNFRNTKPMNLIFLMSHVSIKSIRIIIGVSSLPWLSTVSQIFGREIKGNTHLSIMFYRLSKSCTTPPWMWSPSTEHPRTPRSWREPSIWSPESSR